MLQGLERALTPRATFFKIPVGLIAGYWVTIATIEYLGRVFINWMVRLQTISKAPRSGPSKFSCPPSRTEIIFLQIVCLVSASDWVS